MLAARSFGYAQDDMEITATLKPRKRAKGIAAS